MNKLKYYLIASLVLNLALITISIGKRVHYRYYSFNSPVYDYNDIRNSILQNLKVDSTDIVFIGNSLTEAFPVTELYGPHYKNRGINGNTTYQILQRMIEIVKVRPRKIFIEGGINDLTANIKIDSIIANYSKMLAAAAALSPETKCYVQSVLPTANEAARLNKKIVQLNERLRSFCRLTGYIYIDIYSKMLNKHQLDAAYTYDGVHLNGNGYRVWHNALAPYL